MDLATSAESKAAAAHRLQPLLSPRSVVLVGASPRQGSVGHQAARALLDSGFDGPVRFINPRYKEIEGQPCLGDWREVEAPPDLAILNVGAARLEAALAEAIAAGARSAVVFDACRGEAADGGPLLERLRAMAREAALPVCGGNGMGFFNIPEHCHASFYSANHLKPGGITLIAHSGSVFTVLALNDPRYRFDLVVAPGQEIGATIDEYIDFAVERPTTSVVALFLEAARNPAGIAAALEKAHACGVPVVACKVGRTPESAALALSHTGAMAGRDVAYDALFERFGAIRVDTVDQLMNLSMLLAQGRSLGAGELASVTDSGGLRELFIDRAGICQVPMARLSEATTVALDSILPPGLPASNPLDCAGAISEGFDEAFDRGLASLAAAPEVGLLGFEIDARDDHSYNPGIVDIAHRLPQITDKTCFVYSSFARANNRALSDSLADAGVPLLNGLDETLSAVSGLRRLRDLREGLRDEDSALAGPDAEIVARWRANLRPGTWLGEAAGLALLADFGIPSVPCRRCTSWSELRDTAAEIGTPLVLKTAAEGIAHKSDVGGVVANIGSIDALEAAYRDMADRLGPEVLLQQMVAGGQELAFGYLRDPDFGPLVMVSAGGTLIEILDDRRFALAPFGPRRAVRLLEQLKLYPLLRGVRGGRPLDLQGLAVALARFSVLCAALYDQVEEIDVNPVLVREDGVVAVDALVATRGSGA